MLTPVPFKAMLCGDPAALSVTVMVAVAAPNTVGAKCPWMVQFAPTARLVPQLLANTNSDALVPVTAMLVIVNAAVPLLVIVTVCEVLVKFNDTWPNDRLVAENVTGAVGAKPVPVSAMFCGEVVALSVITMVAVFAPADVGAKWPWMVQLAPTARLGPQLLANTNCEPLLPRTAMLVMVSAVVPLLVKVTVCEPLDCPTVTVPKARLPADRVTGGVRPVPLNAMVCGELAALSVMVMVAVKAPTAVGAKCP